MKLSEIQVGGRYVAKVSGNVTIVRVLAIREVPPAGYSRSDRWKTRIDVVNERTRRNLTFASAARLRRPAAPARKEASP